MELRTFSLDQSRPCGALPGTAPTIRNMLLDKWKASLGGNLILN
jgi:hypothetical protein